MLLIDLVEGVFYIMMKLKKLCAGTLLTLAICTMTACGNNDNKNTKNDVTNTPTAAVENNTTDNVGGNGTAAGENNGANVDNMENDNANGDNIIEDVGEAGKDVIDGVENAADDLIDGTTDNNNNNDATDNNNTAAETTVNPTITNGATKTAR